MVLTPFPVAAQQAPTWPTQPIRLIDSFPPGAPGDVIARMIRPALEKALGQPVTVENIAGDGGNLGAQAVARATNGHTVLVGPDTMFTVNPFLYKSKNFDAMTVLAPVTQLASFNQMLVCQTGAKLHNLDQMLSTARKGPVRYGSGGVGAPGHIAMAMLLASKRVVMTHVPYKGPNPAMKGVLDHEVACAFLTAPVVGPLVRQGQLEGIAVSGPRRLKNWPYVPAMAELGVPSYDATFTEMMAMPRNTPPEVIQKLQTVVAEAMGSPLVRIQLARMDLEPVNNTPAQAAARLATERQRWSPVLQDMAKGD